MSSGPPCFRIPSKDLCPLSGPLLSFLSGVSQVWVLQTQKLLVPYAISSGILPYRQDPVLTKFTVGRGQRSEHPVLFFLCMTLLALPLFVKICAPDCDGYKLGRGRGVQSSLFTFPFLSAAARAPKPLPQFMKRVVLV